MADQRLINYIKKELAAGYKPEAVRTYLINYGYNAADVDEALKAAIAKPVPAAARKIPILPIVGGVVAVLFIVVIVLIFFAGKKEVEVVKVAAEKLDLKVSMLSSNVRQGNSVQFTVILTSLDGKSHDVGFFYEIIDSTGTTISQKEDFISVKQKSVEQKTIDIPSDVRAGSYNLAVTGRFDGEIVRSSIGFGVLSAGAEIEKAEIVEVAEIECPPSCDDDDPCTDDQCSAATNYECVHFAIKPCCGNLRCEEYENYNNCPTDCSPPLPAGVTEIITLTEITQNARNYASTNLAQAENYCNGLAERDQKDSCFYEVAQTAKKSKYCDVVFSELKRDNCYSEFALAGDFGVCSKMTNKYMKESCFELEAASKTAQLR